MNVRSGPSHDAPNREPDNLGDDLEHQNDNAMGKPGICSNSENVDRAHDDSEEALRRCD